MMKPYLLVVALIAMSTSANLFAEHQLTGIEVTGKGAVNVTPDIFTLSLTVVERGKNTEKVKQLVDSKSNRFINAINKLGIDKSNIEAYQLSIYPIYRRPAIRLNNTELKTQFANGDKGKVHLNTANDDQSRIETMEVSRQIKVSLTSLAHFDKLMMHATKIGIKRISPLQAEISNPELAYQRALDKAIQDAKNKALYMAGQSGVTLGKITYLKELSYGAPVRMAFAEAKTSFDSIAGQQQVQAQVMVNWSIN